MTLGHKGFVVDPDEPPQGMHHSTQILLDEPDVQYLSSSDCLEVLDTDISWAPSQVTWSKLINFQRF